MHSARLLGAAVLSIAATASQMFSQAWSYPAFQIPRIVEREWNIGVADGGIAGVSAVFQWREQTSTLTQLSIDAGVADPDRGELGTSVFVGGQFAYQLSTATNDAPLDFMLTSGFNIALSKRPVFRVPVGVVVGHKFLLEGDLAITPFVHPRISLDICSKCTNSTELGLIFDLGANLDLTRSLALRAAAFFGGSDLFDDDGFGISIAWRPPPLTPTR